MWMRMTKRKEEMSKARRRMMKTMRARQTMTKM